MMFGYDAKRTRQDFPVLSKPVIYFDSACMSLKPRQVTEKMKGYYEEYTACGGRSSHKFASRVEEETAKSRNEIKNFINAKNAEEIIFTRNTTEGINLVANSLKLEEGDEVMISDKEHNSNLIPWLKLKKKGIKLNVVQSNADSTFGLENFKSMITKKTRLVSVVHTSNIDGVANPVREITKIAHEKGSIVMVDAAQAAPSAEVDARKLDVDFLAFSGHKMLGPTGTGILYGKRDLLEDMEQFIVGGETVIDSTYETYKQEELPMKFEAGLQDYAGMIGLGEACRYLKRIGMDKIMKHEIALNKIITDSLSPNKKIKIIGPEEAEKRSGIFSFNIEGIDPHTISHLLEKSRGIMTRSGAHCCHSWFNKHNMKGSARASLYLYNTEEEAKIFVQEVEKILKM